MAKKKVYIAGRRPVKEALAGRRRIFHIYIAKDITPSKAMDELLVNASAQSIPVTRVDKIEISRLTGDILNQGIVAEVSEFQYSDLSGLIKTASSKEQSLVILLDGIKDPQNLGAVIRTAVVAGADGLVIPRHRAAPVTTAVVKSSAGAVEHAKVATANIAEAVDRLKEAGFWIVGADAGASAPIWDLDLTGRTALAFGAEEQGLTRLVKAKCDFLANLPVVGPVESLNVSAAAAAMIYETIRQKH